MSAAKRNATTTETTTTSTEIKRGRRSGSVVFGTGAFLGAVVRRGMNLPEGETVPEAKQELYAAKMESLKEDLRKNDKSAWKAVSDFFADKVRESLEKKPLAAGGFVPDPDFQKTVKKVLNVAFRTFGDTMPLATCAVVYKLQGEKPFTSRDEKWLRQQIKHYASQPDSGFTVTVNGPQTTVSKA